MPIASPGITGVGQVSDFRKVNVGWLRPSIVVSELAKMCFSPSSGATDMFTQLKTKPPVYSTSQSLKTLTIEMADTWDKDNTSTPYAMIILPGRIEFKPWAGNHAVNPLAGTTVKGTRRVNTSASSMVTCQCIADSVSNAYSLGWEYAMYLYAFYEDIRKLYILNQFNIHGMTDAAPVKELHGKFMTSLALSVEWTVAQETNHMTMPIRDISLSASPA